MRRRSLLVMLGALGCQPSSVTPPRSMAPTTVGPNDAGTNGSSIGAFADGASGNKASSEVATRPHAPPAKEDESKPADVKPTDAKPAAEKQHATIDADACSQRDETPDCFASFPEKVVCPKAMFDIENGALCGIAGRTRAPQECAYPEGRCSCVTAQYCGGVAPTFLQQAGMHWACRPPRRPDDCPDAAAPGQKCPVNGKQCGYGGCGVSTHCTCTGGRFQCATEHWAPPPSAPPAR